MFVGVSGSDPLRTSTVGTGRTADPSATFSHSGSQLMNDAPITFRKTLYGIVWGPASGPSSVRKTWVTFPVMTAKSTWRGGKVVASPWTHVT
jgi:hypothetical protein